MHDTQIEVSRNVEKVMEKVEELTRQYQDGLWYYPEYVAQMYVIFSGQRNVILNDAKRDIKVLGGE